MSNLQAHALNLEAASQKMEAANNHANAIQEKVSLYSQRIAEERSKQAKAIADYRAGLIDMGVASLVQRTTDLDIADLEKMLAPEQAALNDAYAIVNKAREVYEHAAKVFRAAEKQVAIDEFSVVVKGLERKFLESIVELYKLSGATNGVIWKIYEPSKELKDLVGLQTVPVSLS